MTTVHIACGWLKAQQIIGSEKGHDAEVEDKSFEMKKVYNYVNVFHLKIIGNREVSVIHT